MQEVIDFIYKNNLIEALVIIFITWLIALIASRLLSKKIIILPRKLTKNDETKLSSTQLTRLKMVKRLVLLSIYLIGISIAILQMPALRALGTALLASAGFIGLIAGLAARPSLSNLIAGITIAFAQPIRIGDYVEIMDKVGIVEELTLTFTVIKTMDERRLVVPNAVIVDSAILNHSLETPEVLAEVIVPVPYGTDIDKARHALVDIAKQSSNYSKKKEPEVIVKELDDEKILLKILALAKDARCAYFLSADIKEGAARQFVEKELCIGKNLV